MSELLNGSRWFQMGVVLGCLAVGATFTTREGASARATLLRRLHLFFGCVVAMQGVGHIVAVTIRSSLGALTTTTPLPLLWAIGLVFAVPSLALVLVAALAPIEAAATQRCLLGLDVALAVGLLAGIFSGPLALFAILAVVALRRDTRGTRRGVAIATTLVAAAMLVTSFFVGGGP